MGGASGMNDDKRKKFLMGMVMDHNIKTNEANGCQSLL
jgi:hypothetical protein